MASLEHKSKNVERDVSSAPEHKVNVPHGRKRAAEENPQEPSKVIARERSVKVDECLKKDGSGDGKFKVDISKVATEWTCKGLRINCLPSSILLRVFSYIPHQQLLNRVCLVCKVWYDLSLDASLWRNIKLSIYKKLNDDAIVRIIERFKNVKNLDVSDLPGVSSQALFVSLVKCRMLAKLRMMNCKPLKWQMFEGIFMCCSALQHLYLDGSSSICDKGLLSISRYCPKLEKLVISQCSQVTDEGMIAVAEACPRLKLVGFGHGTKTTDASIKALADHCPQLQSLSCIQGNLTDDGVRHLVKVKTLTFIDVSMNRNLTNGSIIPIVAGCSGLECLHVSLCINISDPCIDYIARNAKCLKKIYMVSCNLTDKALLALGEHCKTIESIDVGWCKDITDHGVESISKLSPNLNYLGIMRCDRVSIPLTEELQKKYPCITYSSVWLDCKRLVEKAKNEGINLPSLALPSTGPALLS